MDIYRWEESKGLDVSITVSQNINFALRAEIEKLRKENIMFSDDQFVHLIEDCLHGLQFLRENGMFVTIDLGHLCSFSNKWKWFSYEPIEFNHHQEISI